MAASCTADEPEAAGALTDHDSARAVGGQKSSPRQQAPVAMRREFGSVIPDLLDAPQNAVTRDAFDAVPPLSRWLQWEP